MSSDPPMTAAQWDARYRAEPDLWTKEPNAPLAQFAGELEPARALEVGAGDGRNAIWLATQGWAVTAIDLSTVALQRAAERAAARGVQLECIVADWREHGFGASAFELVVVSFMHPQPNERQALFERVARALVPGGHVFTVGVILADHGRRGPPDPERLYTLEGVHHALRGFELLRCEEQAYEQEHSSGPAGHRRRGGRSPAVAGGHLSRSDPLMTRVVSTGDGRLRPPCGSWRGRC